MKKIRGMFVICLVLSLLLLGGMREVFAKDEGVQSDSERACLGLNVNDPSYRESVDVLLSLPVVKKWSASLPPQIHLALGGEAFDKTAFMNGACYWDISLYESRSDGMHRWNSFRVNHKTKEVFMMDAEGEYVRIP